MGVCLVEQSGLNSGKLSDQISLGRLRSPRHCHCTCSRAASEVHFILVYRVYN